MDGIYMSYNGIVKTNNNVILSLFYGPGDYDPRFY